MTITTERSLEELYAQDPERADAVVFGRKANLSRRGFLNGAGLAAMAGSASRSRRRAPTRRCRLGMRRAEDTVTRFGRTLAACVDRDCHRQSRPQQSR